MNKYTFIIFSLLVATITKALGYKGHIDTKTETTEALDSIGYCQKVIEEVDSMQLICDTLHIETSDDHECYYQFKGIYFDKNKRLRKYWRKEVNKDASAECIDMSVYYDQYGDLVYIGIESSYHCGEDNEFFHICKGRIIDYSYSGSCFCCDDEEVLKQEELINDSDNDDSATEEEQEQWLPAVGEPLSITAGWGFSLKRFIYADTLIKYLKGNYYNEEFSDNN